MDRQDFTREQRAAINLGDIERIASIIGGSGFLLDALLSRSWRRFPSSVLGAFLMYRGIRGYCPAYQRLAERLQLQQAASQPGLAPRSAAGAAGPPTGPAKTALGAATGGAVVTGTVGATSAEPEGEEDRVSQASEESFPASDPPAW
jgi:hypothetical protein